jgi:hypothetical protein
MAAYATNAEFEAYVEGWTTTNGAALTRLLERASRDIDALMGPRRILTTGTYAGLKYDPTKLADAYADALSRATCAQAEYRFAIGEEEFAQHGTAGRVKGPDFEVELAKGSSGGRPRIGPKVAVELEPLLPFRRLTARGVA